MELLIILHEKIKFLNDFASVFYPYFLMEEFTIYFPFIIEFCQRLCKSHVLLLWLSKVDVHICCPLIFEILQCYDFFDIKGTLGLFCSI